MPKQQKKRKKKPKNGATSYIEKIGSPILRKNVFEDFDLSDPTHRSAFCASEQWLAFCNKANFVFRLMQKEAVAIAATQLNFPFPAFIWKPFDQFEIVLMPDVSYAGLNWVSGSEGCLSIPGENFEVKRVDYVVLRGYDRYGDPLEERQFEGFDARVVQHEVDHLYGGLIVDYSEDKSGYLRRIREGVYYGSI